MKERFLCRFQAEGLHLEKLMRLAAERQIPLTRVRRKGRRLTGCAPEAAMPQLQELAAHGGWALEVRGYAGWSRLREQVKRRWLVCVLCALAVAGVVTAMQLVWAVELVDAGPYEGDVRAFLQEQGIRPMMWRAQVEPAALRDALEWRYPRVAWVEVGWRGTVLHIRLVQGVAQGETVDWRGSRDVVASRDGVVVSVVPLAGTARCKPGDTVRKGQVLIAGEERDGAETMRPVAARGKVTARVWDGARVRMSTMERQTIYTGAVLERNCVQTPWFSLWPREESGFQQQDVEVTRIPLGGLFFPLWVQRERCLEAQVSAVSRPLEEVQGEAGLAALRKLRTQVGPGEVFIDKWVDYCMINSEILEAVATGERRVEIGVLQERGGA